MSDSSRGRQSRRTANRQTEVSKGLFFLLVHLFPELVLSRFSQFRFEIQNLMDMKNLQEFHSHLSSPSPPSSSSSSSISNLHPLDTGAEEWEVAEKRVQEILSVIQPTVISEGRRKEIIEYIQILIGSSYGIKVFPFGSVPLKTYLPDGGIDLTAMCHNDEEALSSVFCCLQNEEMMNTQIQVRNVQCVPAQIKFVKCYVEDIAVDITFNQMSGLCALSFLEQVDLLIGKDHLFKRSLILIKGWCFYESRILGAHYGLVSTYALETMVAHIINLFHSSLHSSLAVLHKFLGYYSKFDWENHCVAINGLVLVSSLPAVVAQPPNEADEMLLSAEFLQKCRESHSLSTGMNQTGGRPFYLKFLNVVDPLRDNNNIGRSVNKANFNRLKSALSFAAEKLNCILALPLDEISVGVETFFKTILARNGIGKRPDGVPVPGLVDGRSEAYEKLVDNENLLAGIEYGLWSHDFGIYQGCNNPVFPEMWTMWNQLGLGGRYDPNALFQVNEKLAPFLDAYNFSRVTNVLTKSRGTGTYIPQLVHDEGMPFGQSRRRAYAPHFSQPFVPIESLCVAEGGSISYANTSSYVNTSLVMFPALPATDPTGPYLAAQEAFDNFSLQSIEYEMTQMLPPYSAFLPVDNSTPAVDPPIHITKAEEKNELPENDAKMMGGANDLPDPLGLRLGDPSEFPPLLRKPHASERK